jgi:two-component system, sensor histidine kinase YesM
MRNSPFKFIKNLSIFQKMILSFVIIIILPVLLSYVISSKTIENLVVTQNYRDTLSSVEVALGSISGVTNELLHAAVYVCNDDLVRDFVLELDRDEKDLNGKEQANRLAQLRKAESVISNVFFVNRINAYITLISRTGSLGYVNYPITDAEKQKYLLKYTPDYLKQLGSSIHFVGIEKNYVEKSSKDSSHVITWIKSIESKKDGSLIGVLIVSLPEKEITNLMTPESIPVKRILLDSRMNVIASTYKPWLSKKFDSISGENIPGNGKGHVNIIFTNEEKYSITYERLKGNGWTLADIKPVSELSGKLHETSNKFLFLNLVSILIFLFIAAAIARGISVPLHRLSKTMLATDLNVFNNPDSGSSRDEVRVLEDNFDIMRRNINTLMKENVETERKKRVAELQALQSQINPHFLFNTLNAVRCAADTDKKDKVSEMIVSLINLLSMTLVKGEELIPLDQEIDILLNYVKIMQMRHGITIELYVDIPEILKDYKIPKLLFQPLIENSIIHGFEGLNCTGIIEITGSLDENGTIIRISDNGKGLEFNPLDYVKSSSEGRFSGIGVANVNERLKMYYGSQYGIRYLNKQGDGTVVEVVLPGLPEE